MESWLLSKPILESDPIVLFLTKRTVFMGAYCHRMGLVSRNLFHDPLIFCGRLAQFLSCSLYVGKWRRVSELHGCNNRFADDGLTTWLTRRKETHRNGRDFVGTMVPCPSFIYGICRPIPCYGVPQPDRQRSALISGLFVLLLTCGRNDTFTLSLSFYWPVKGPV